MNEFIIAPTIRTRITRCFLLVSIVALLFVVANAQTSATDGSTPAGMSPGAPAGSYALTGFENVNLFNGHLNFHLPLLQVGGRGSAGYTINLNLERQWRTRKTPPPIVIYPETGPWGSLEVGYSPGVLLGRVVGAPNWGSCEENEGWRDTLTRLTFVGADGTEYELIDKLTMGVPQQTYYNVDCSIGYNFNRGKVFVTHDGSGVTFNSDEDILDAYGFAIDEIRPSGYLLMKDGTRYRIGGGVVTSIQDRNGNKVTLENVGRTITDSLNRVVTVAYGYDSNPDIDYDQISFKGTGGAARTIRIWKSNLSDVLRSGFSIQTWQQLFPEMNGSTSNQFNPPVVSSVELPDGRRYWFKYNPYGELARVELPTGGAIEYDYAAGLRSGVASGSYGGGGAYTTKQIYRRVVERRVYKDSLAVYESKMTISRPENSVTETDGYVLVEQRDYAGNLLASDKHYFYGTAVVPNYQTPLDYSFWKDGRELKTESLSLTGSVLRAVEHTWANSGGNPQITQSVTTLSDTNQVAKQTFLYDQYNNKTDVYEYAYGTGISGALIRRTHTDYVTTNVVDGVTYNYDTDLAIHLRSLPKQTSAYDAAGVEQARTTFEYDNYANDARHKPLVGRTGITGHAASYTATFTMRGNATGVTSYANAAAGTGPVTSSAQYDVAGNVVATLDGLFNSSTIGYSDSFCNGTTCGGTFTPNTFAFASTTTSPVPDPSGQYGSSSAFVTTSVYDFWTGRATSTTDANNQTTSFQYNDVLDRPTQVTRAVGTAAANQTTFDYDDASHVVTTTSDLNTLNDNALVSKVLYDGLGRTVETRQYEGGANYISAQQQYDALGRAFKTSTPFRPWKSESALWTTTGFDALGRVISVTTPDSAVVTTSYTGNTVTVADQTGKQRKSITDGLGRLKEVYEDPAGLNYLTSYSYDVLDNLTSVSQGVQTRSFVYDSLKRLTSATNPESGTISYQYDDNGNLTQKTDARSIVTSYAYDALNRNTTVNYSDTTSINPDITRIYDTATNGKGRLRESYAGGGETVGTTVEHTKIISYDALGRPLDQRQRFKTASAWSAEYQTGRTYNLAGGVTGQTYPSGHTVSYAYDAAGRTNSFSGNLGDGVQRTYASEIIYSSLGGMAKERFGTDTPLYNKLWYNSRGQLAEMRVSTTYAGSWDTSWNRGAIVNHYSNQCWGMCAGQSMPDNDGNVKKQEHQVPDNDQVSSSQVYLQSYGYDNLNRLQSVSETKWVNGTPTATLNQVFDYDRYGNRTINQGQTWGGVNNKQFTVNAGNNRLGVPGGQSGVMTYDNAGNLTTDTYSGSAATRVYDAENRMTSETQAGNFVAGLYTYNADGQRVRRKAGAVETWQIYGFDGELLAEYAANAAATTAQKEYGYRNGQLLITAEAGSGGDSGAQPVTWTNAVGVAASGNNLTKTAAEGWGNAGAASTQTIASGDGYVEATATETNTYRLIGLSNGDSHQNYDDIDFAFYPAIGATLYIYEGGASRGTFGSYATGDVLRVAVEGGVVKYRKNGTLLYTSTVAPSYPLLVDTAFYSPGATINNVVISSGGGGGSGVAINWLVADQLGTPRMIFDKTGSLATTKRHDYLPFGEELVAGQGLRTTTQGYLADNVRQKFTSKERDNETGLDYFLARYYSSTQGRFTSPDEFSGGPDELYHFADDVAANPTFYADLTNPQSLNKYQYTYNNPLNMVDPDGHDPDGDPQGTKDQPVQVPAIWPFTMPPAEVTRAVQDGATAVGNAAKDLGKDAVRALNVVTFFIITLHPATPAPPPAQPTTATPPSQTQPLPPPPPIEARTKKVQPVPGASGPHSVAKRDPRTGKITGYTEFGPNGQPKKRFRGQGKTHGGVKPPLILEPKKPGKRPNRARPARPDEIP